jgi:hypothetical protein
LLVTALYCRPYQSRSVLKAPLRLATPSASKILIPLQYQYALVDGAALTTPTLLPLLLDLALTTRDHIRLCQVVTQPSPRYEIYPAFQHTG